MADPTLYDRGMILENSSANFLFTVISQCLGVSVVKGGGESGRAGTSFPRHPRFHFHCLSTSLCRYVTMSRSRSVHTAFTLVHVISRSSTLFLWGGGGMTPLRSRQFCGKVCVSAASARRLDRESRSPLHLCEIINCHQSTNSCIYYSKSQNGPGN